MVVRRIVFVFFLSLTIQLANGQDADSSFFVKPNPKLSISATYKLEKDINLIDTCKTNWMDSTLQENPNPVWRSSSFIHDLGYWGAPSKDYSSNNRLPFGFIDGLDFFDIYELDEPKYITTTSPITKLSYHQGDNDLIALNLNHAQSLHPGFSFGINYRRLKQHNTYYANIKDIEARIPNHHQTQIWAIRQTANNRYEIFGTLTLENFRHVETAGISDELLFANSQALANNQLAFLSDASNHLKNNLLKCKQVFRLGPLKQHIVERDSATDTLALVEATSMLWHKLEIIERQNTYKDLNPDSSYYQLPFSMLEIYDRKRSRQLKNSFGWESSWYGFQFNVGTQFNIIETQFNASIFRNLHNFSVKTDVQKSWKKSQMDFQFIKGITGYNKNDFLFETSLSKAVGEFALDLNVKSQKMTSPFFYNFNEGILSNWRLDAKQIFVNRALAKISKKEFEFSQSIDVVRHPIYFDSTGIPQQKRQSASLLTSQVNWGASIFPWLKLHTNSSIQIGNDDDVFRMPMLHTKTKLYIPFYLFNSHLKSHLGFDLMAWSKYKSVEYNPYNQQFQNGKQDDIQRYMVINPYFSGGIKNFSFYIKMIHVNQAWMGYNYYRVSRHPLQRRGLRIGISWSLNN